MKIRLNKKIYLIIFLIIILIIALSLGISFGINNRKGAGGGGNKNQDYTKLYIESYNVDGINALSINLGENQTLNDIKSIVSFNNMGDKNFYIGSGANITNINDKYFQNLKNIYLNSNIWSHNSLNYAKDWNFYGISQPFKINSELEYQYLYIAYGFYKNAQKINKFFIFLSTSNSWNSNMNDRITYISSIINVYSTYKKDSAYVNAILS